MSQHGNYGKKDSIFQEEWQKNEIKRVSIERGKVCLNQLKARARFNQQVILDESQTPEIVSPTTVEVKGNLQPRKIV